MSRIATPAEGQPIEAPAPAARFRLSSDDRDYKMGFRVVREEN